MNRPRALLSVWDKAGVAELGRRLVDRGWEVLSTGGTARALRAAGIPVTDVSLVTNHPEMLGGRIKTLHPAIHAGLLARRGVDQDMRALAELGYQPIDLVAVNLYPFGEVVEAPDATLDQALGHIDIGGTTLIRAAAKNHRSVWVVVDPGDYEPVLRAIDDEANEQSSQSVSSGELRRRLAAKVFRETSCYDCSIATYMSGDKALEDDDLIVRMNLLGTPLRYGENPDQSASFYSIGDTRSGIAALTQLQGKALSYNNILDLDGAMAGLAPFAHAPQAAVCIVKHATPCGMAARETLAEAFARARATDPPSAFGSVIALNRMVDRETAQAMASLFVECVVAPGFSGIALEVLGQKKNVRLLAFPAGNEDDWRDFLCRAGGCDGVRSLRSVYGGTLIQSTPPAPRFVPNADPNWAVVTKRTPSPAEARDLGFAWAAVATVKSNAILLARDLAAVGIGSGQTSRVASVGLALQKARDNGLTRELEGCVLASDAFFPFRDGVDLAARAGVRAIVQPGGSIRDDEVVAAADSCDIAMVFTRRRLFRH